VIPGLFLDLSCWFRGQLCMVHKLGYGNWDELQVAVRQSHLFKFGLGSSSPRLPVELARRCAPHPAGGEENAELDERERQAKKDRKGQTGKVKPGERTNAGVVCDAALLCVLLCAAFNTVLKL